MSEKDQKLGKKWDKQKLFYDTDDNNIEQSDLDSVKNPDEKYSDFADLTVAYCKINDVKRSKRAEL